MKHQVNRELQNFVLDACDKLYANRQLITQKVVKQMVVAYGDWSADDIDLYLPVIINEWRLKNLADDDRLIVADRVSALENQLSKYQVSLDIAQRTIDKLKCEMRSVSQTAQQQRELIIRELRTILTSNRGN